jgi:hypothetical protein
LESTQTQARPKTESTLIKDFLRPKKRLEEHLELRISIENNKKLRGLLIRGDNMEATNQRAIQDLKMKLIAASLSS